MRVLCIADVGSDSPWKWGYTSKTTRPVVKSSDLVPGPVYMEECTVLDTIENGGYYLLLGYEEYGYYNASQFIPLQEDSAHKKKEEQKIMATAY